MSHGEFDNREEGEYTAPYIWCSELALKSGARKPTFVVLAWPLTSGFFRALYVAR